MELTLIEALLYSILPTLLGTLITLYFTEKVKGRVKIGFDKKLEEIKKEHNIDITKFQVDLNSLKSKENFKFTKLHEKRFDILEKIYKLLNKSLNELRQYISPVKTLPDRTEYEDNEDKLQKKFLDSHNKFANYFSDNKIYLNENIILLIENYLNEMSETYSDYSTNHYFKKFGDKPNAEVFQKAMTAYKKVPDIILPIKKEIEESFRELLEK